MCGKRLRHGNECHEERSCYTQYNAGSMAPGGPYAEALGLARRQRSEGKMWTRALIELV